MTTNKKKGITQKTTTEKFSINKTGIISHKIDFEPKLNGSYRISFSEEYAEIGFSLLLKGGRFYRLPKGFVISKVHKKLLDEAKIPYNQI